MYYCPYFEPVFRPPSEAGLLILQPIVTRLHPRHTILWSNHVSNILHLAGSYPKDRARIITQAEAALAAARCHPQWCNHVPNYEEEYF
jgi:hypothetical protein